MVLLKASAELSYLNSNVGLPTSACLVNEVPSM